MKFKNTLYALCAGSLALSMLGHISIASAATGFVEDFSGGNLPSNLERVGGAGSAVSPGTSCCGGQVGGAVFENGQVRFQGRDTRGDSSGGLRAYLRTLEADYSSVSFVADVTVTVPPAPGSPNIGRNIVFFGLGPVLPVDIYGGPAGILGSNIGVGILPDNFFPRFQVGNKIINHIDATCGGNGTHRMRLEWNAETKTAITSIDQDYFGGPFIADCTLAPITSFANNILPVASAGTDFTVNTGDPTGLNGSGSFTPNGTQQTNGRIYIGGDWDAIFDDFEVTITPTPIANLEYQWTQIAPALPVIALSDAIVKDPSFTAPVVAMNTTFTFELTVTSGTSQATDTVDVTVVANLNNPPIADAGLDIVIKPGALAALNGNDSYDPEGDLFTYSWTQILGTTVNLSDAAAATPDFTVPNALGDVLTFVLQVDDGMNASVPSDGTSSAVADTVSVTIVDNAAPVAEAGTSQIKNEGDSVNLDGSASSDPDGDMISYSWVQLAGTTPVLNLVGANTVNPAFDLPTVSVDEDIVFELTVTDNDIVNAKSNKDTVTIRNTDSNSPPTCDLAFASKGQLWPPNHKMKSISIGGVIDEDVQFNTVTISITGVTQDESVNGNGDGDTSPDAIIGDQFDTALIRSERSGNNDGRVYSIQFTASDGFESCDGAVTVSVPKKRKSTAVDSGQSYLSTQD
ncbi:MAG: PKD domain-containing protein [Oceanospirillaceae bacterium]